MKREIPVWIGYHSLPEIPHAKLMFDPDSDVEERLVESLLDDATFTVSVSAVKRDGGQDGPKYIIQEIRFLPTPRVKRDRT